MLNPSTRIARVYAEAMISVGEEQGLLGSICDELRELGRLYREDREFRGFFTSPRINAERKFVIIEKALGDQVSKPVLGLLHVLIRKGREAILDNVVDYFERIKDRHEGRIDVHIQTARPLGEDQKEEIRTRVGALMKKTAFIKEQVVPELIGGTIVRVGDYVVDGSIRRRLLALRKSLVAKEQIFD